MSSLVWRLRNVNLRKHITSMWETALPPSNSLHISSTLALWLDPALSIPCISIRAVQLRLLDHAVQPWVRTLPEESWKMNATRRSVLVLFEHTLHRSNALPTIAGTLCFENARVQ